MLENTKKYGLLFIAAISLLFTACSGRTYNPNYNVAPSGISYSYYNYGTGTSFSDGALVVNIHSNSSYNYSEYYVVQIYGLGGYTLQPGYNQLFIPNIWPNSYNFSIEKVCTAGNNSDCFSKTLTGIATINVEMTTVVDVWI